ncbi:MAG: glycosyltransferase [Anaerolineaceae bacterium]|nr:glycosyltransferase [Anaerolineaceae bacterium]
MNNHIKQKWAPTISVVTCTYNSKKFLLKALHSMESQTYPYIEHIINDSFSTDGSMEMIESYKKRNQSKYPIKVIHTEPHGVAKALNIATNAASGNIIHYLHSDDYYDRPDALEQAASYFINDPDLVWMTGNFYIEFKGEKLIIPHSHLLKIKPETSISLMNVIHHENTFVKKNAVINYGGFCENKAMNVEYRLWLRLIKDHKPLVVNNQFTIFIIHQGSTSTGNIVQFSKAILRGFNTLQQEKVFPFIGYYEDKEFFKNFEKIHSSTQKFMSLLLSGDIVNYKWMENHQKLQQIQQKLLPSNHQIKSLFNRFVFDKIGVKTQKPAISRKDK